MCVHKFRQFFKLLDFNFWQIFGITNERFAVDPMTQSSEIPLIRHIYFCFSPVVSSHWWFQTFLASRRPNPKFRARASRALLEARVSAPSVSSRRQSSFFRARNRSAKIGWKSTCTGKTEKRKRCFPCEVETNLNWRFCHFEIALH